MAIYSISPLGEEPATNPVLEAQRYVKNAKNILLTNGKYDPETNCYQDPKYVKAAGHYLWNAILLILDAVFEVKTKQRPHPDVKDYRSEVVKRDRKLLTLLNAAYETTHITMGYDGNLSKKESLSDQQFLNQASFSSTESDRINSRSHSCRRDRTTCVTLS